MQTAKLHHIEDHEGTGECQECGRTGLRWVCYLTDGSRVGTECAKRVMGWKPAPKQYNWVPNFDMIATHEEGGDAWCLWQRQGAAQTVETRNGVLYSIGGARSEWIAKGWVA